MRRPDNSLADGLAFFCDVENRSAGRSRCTDSHSSDLTDTIVFDIGNVEVAGGIKRHADRIIELGAGGWSRIAVISQRPVAGHGGDDARRRRMTVYKVALYG